MKTLSVFFALCLILPVFAGPIESLPVGQWLELPNTKIRSVLPSPVPGGNTGPTSITVAWNGAAVDSKRSRLIIWGGGHGDYFGNEMYALDLPNMSISRLTNPSTYCNQSNCTDFLPDNTPTARHTYDGLTYMSHADRFVSFGGALSPCGNGSSKIWTFNFAASQWKMMSPTSPVDWDGNGQMAVYDSATQRIYFDQQTDFCYYTFGMTTGNPNGYTHISTHAYLDYHLSATIDTKRRKFVILGDGVNIIDLTTGALSTMTTSNTPGIATSGQNPGISYDPVADRIVAWHGGKNVYALNMDTQAWTAYSPASGPTSSAPSQGTYGRWNYVPGYSVFAMVNSIDENGWVFRLSAGTGVETARVKFAGLSLAATPNPFSVSTRIDLFAGADLRNAQVKVYNLDGKQVADLSGKMLNGTGIAWKPSGLSAGIYVVKADLGNRQISRTLLYQK
jgi:hypothetical protein